MFNILNNKYFIFNYITNLNIKTKLIRNSINDFQRKTFSKNNFFINNYLNSSLNLFLNKFSKNLSIFFFNVLMHIFQFKLKVAYFVCNWVYTTNHKRIAVNYFWFVILSGIVGMVLATIIRLEFAYPGVGVLAGDSIQYLSLASAHGVIMVFFMIMPLLFGAFANFLIPTQLGVHDVAFPRLNSAAFWFLPGGLLLLCQLVCIDRRFQRMNCFNVREAESLLKRKFFVDLINSKDLHELYNDTALSLRYKTFNKLNLENNFNINLDYSNSLISYFKKIQLNNFFTNKKSFGLNNKILSENSYNFFLISYFKNNNFFSVINFSFLNIFENFFNKIQSFNFYLDFSKFNLILNEILEIFKNFFFNLSTTSFKTTFNSIYYFFNYILNLIIYQLFNLIFNFIIYSLIDIFFYFKIIFLNIFYFFTFFQNYFFNYDLEKLFLSYNNYIKFNFQLFNPIIFLNYVIYSFSQNLLILKSLQYNFYFFQNLNFFIFNYFSDLNQFFKKNLIINFSKFFFNTNDLKFNTYFYKYKNVNTLEMKDNFLFNFQEKSTNSRHLRFNNPLFKYDFKSGDYLTKLHKDLYFYLIPSFVNFSTGLRTPSWYYSAILKELMEKFLLNNLSSRKENIQLKTPLHPYSFKLNKISNSDIFYNMYGNLLNSNYLNFKWVSINQLNTKFNRLFLTSSMQQRLYSNWRQLKFSREAWRCKLLISKNQKTFFKRYLNEDGVFWSIERNAKDLIPGWAMITPFSSRTRYTAVGKTDIGLMGVLLVLNSSIISGANFLVTYKYLSTLNNRKMRDARAFFTEAVLVASWMMIFANPMLVIGIIMLLSDRHWQTSFFDYSGGGDTVLFQHMFWFFGHPEVYVIIIPTFGFTNTMMSFYLKKRVSARASLLYSLYTIAFLGFFVWGHHMYMVGLSHTTRMLFSTLTVMISVPAATKIMHWCVTTANSSFAMELPLLFTFTFIFFFVSGGISGMCVAHTGMDILFHDTFYVIGHFHVMLAGGAMFASFGAFYFYFSAIFGVKYSRIWAYLHYVYYLIGQLMTVIPMFWLGYAGMPRRVLDYPSAFGGWHSVISAGHMLNVAGLIAFFIMIFDSLRQSRAATRNTFGIGRYNTRINFYFYETSKLIFLQQKALFLFKPIQFIKTKKNPVIFKNHELYESTLFSYIFIK